MKNEKKKPLFNYVIAYAYPNGELHLGYYPWMPEDVMWYGTRQDARTLLDWMKAHDPEEDQHDWQIIKVGKYGKEQ